MKHQIEYSHQQQKKGRKRNKNEEKENAEELWNSPGFGIGKKKPKVTFKFKDKILDYDFVDEHYFGNESLHDNDANQERNKNKVDHKDDHTTNNRQLDKTIVTHCGLINLGNTCYFNSVIQALVNTPKFLDGILCSSKGDLALSLRELFLQMKCSNQKMYAPGD